MALEGTRSRSVASAANGARRPFPCGSAKVGHRRLAGVQTWRRKLVEMPWSCSSEARPRPRSCRDSGECRLKYLHSRRSGTVKSPPQAKGDLIKRRCPSCMKRRSTVSQIARPCATKPLAQLSCSSSADAAHLRCRYRRRGDPHAGRDAERRCEARSTLTEIANSGAPITLLPHHGQGSPASSKAIVGS
jgi:hypothetical protein